MSGYLTSLYFNQSLVVLDTTPASTSQFSTGSMVLYGGLSVSGLLNASSIVSNNGSFGTIMAGGITTGTLNVTGGAMFNQGITAGCLNVTGSSNLQTGVTAGTINVTGDSVLNGNTTIGALNVTGSTYLGNGATSANLNAVSYTHLTLPTIYSV